MPRKRPDPGGRLQERGGIYGAYQTPSTPFSAPSAVDRHKVEKPQIFKAHPVARGPLDPFAPEGCLQEGERLLWATQLPVNSLFCTLCSKPTQGRKPQNFKAHPVARGPLDPLAPEGCLQEGERLLWATQLPVNNPSALRCSFWAEAPKPQNKKHKPKPRSSREPRFSGGSFQKKSGFYLPVPLPSTTLLHSPDSRSSSHCQPAILAQNAAVLNRLLTGPARTEAFQMEQTI